MLGYIAWTVLLCCTHLACCAMQSSIMAHSSKNASSYGPSGISKKEKKCTLTFENTPSFKELTENNLLVRYDISFKPERAVNPMLMDPMYSYKADTWIHTTTKQGQRVISTAFSFYGVPPMVVLRMVMRQVPVVLGDEPAGCMDEMYEVPKLEAIAELFLTKRAPPASQLNSEEELSDLGHDREVMCHQVIEATTKGYAKFVTRCCYRAPTQDSPDLKICYINSSDKWLRMLDFLLVCVRLAAFLICPVLIPAWMYTIVSDRTSYEVKLKKNLLKTIMVTSGDVMHPPARSIIDLRTAPPKCFGRLRRSVVDTPRNQVMKARVSQFDIRVDQSLLQTECQPPVSMGRYLVRSLFLCHSSQMGPFHDCCQDIVCGRHNGDEPTLLSDVFRFVGRFTFVVFVLPVFIYMRFTMFYLYEYPEIDDRARAARAMELPVFPDHRLMHQLPAANYIFTTAYAVFIIGGIRLAYLSGKGGHTKFQQAVAASYTDLWRLDMLRDIGGTLSKCLIPFRKCGVFGCIIAVFLAPILVPMYLFVSIIYCLPTVYLSIRIVSHIFSKEEPVVPASPTSQMCSTPGDLFSSCRRISVTLENSLTTVITLLMLYCTMLLLSEVLGFVAELLCLILMGMVVQALKYVSICFLVVVYAFDCYNSVTVKYAKLNKELFTVLRERIDTDLTEYVSMPRYMRRRNRAFKATQTSTQAQYETADGLSSDGTSWNINDLIFFVDVRDHPRIPRDLFEAICRIDLPGSPGPPYRSMLDATCRFFIISSFLAFVFAVVFSFGDTYKVSTINQVMATLAGGFLPFIFNSVLRLKPVEMSALSVSFRCQLEEVIINFWQAWPIRDLRFDVDDGIRGTSDGTSGDYSGKTMHDGPIDVEPSAVDVDNIDPTIDILVRLSDDEYPIAFQDVSTV